MYFKENWKSTVEKEPAFGRVDFFQTSPSFLSPRGSFLGFSATVAVASVVDMLVLGPLEKRRSNQNSLLLVVCDDIIVTQKDLEGKRQLHTPEEKRVAQYAAGPIRDDDAVFLDAAPPSRARPTTSAPPGHLCHYSIERLQRPPRLRDTRYLDHTVVKEV